MVMWRYTPDRRLTLKEVREKFAHGVCLCETPSWARLAERAGAPNHQWVVMGYICTTCNMIVAGVP